MTTTFAFDKTFQAKILALMFQDFEFFNLAQGILHQDYFSDKALSWYFTKMRNYHLDYEVAITEDVLRNELLKAASVNGQIKTDEDIQLHLRYLEIIGQRVLDKDYIVNEVLTFCKHQALKHAILESANLLSTNCFDEIEEKVANALNIGSYVGDIGVQYFPDHKQRAIKREARMDTQVFPTGIPKLDLFLNGGLRVKQLGIWMGPAGRGKCLENGTILITYEGKPVKVENVKVGDKLMGPDSKPRTVLSTTKGTGPMFTINPVKGDPWTCNSEHILTLVHTETGKIIDIPIREYLAKSKWFKHQHKQFQANTIIFPPLKNPLPIDPYFLGVWFGDGDKHMTHNGLHAVCVTKPDPEIEQAIKEIALAYNLRFHKSISTNNCPKYAISGDHKKGQKGIKNPFLDLLRKTVGNLRTIPRSYLVSSVKERQEFLAGFLDADGHMAYKKFEICQKRKDYAEAICFIARSLGLRACMSAKPVKGYGTHWRTNISGNVDQLPLRIPRKQPGPRKINKDAKRTGFKVKHAGIGEYAGFELDGDGRFLLEDFTVTHNSLALSQCGRRTIIQRGKVIHYTFELSADDIADRYDAMFSKIRAHDLIDNEFKVTQRIKDLGLKLGNSLIIKEFPAHEVNINILKAHVQQCIHMGIYPDMILVDYVDLMAPLVRQKQRRDELSEMTGSLRSFAKWLVIPVWSATQSRRASISMETHTEEDVGEDIGKVNIADVVITINQTKEEILQNILRLFLAKNRNGPKYREIPILSNFERNCFYVPN